MLGGPLIRCLQKVPGSRPQCPSRLPTWMARCLALSGSCRLLALPRGPLRRGLGQDAGCGSLASWSIALPTLSFTAFLHRAPQRRQPGCWEPGRGRLQPKQATSQPCGRGWGSGAECPVSIRPELRAAGLWCRRGVGGGRSVSHPGLVWTRPLGAQRGDSRGAGFGLHGLAVCKVAPAQVREDLALRTAESTRARPLPRQGLSCPHLPAHSF